MSTTTEVSRLAARYVARRDEDAPSSAPMRPRTPRRFRAAQDPTTRRAAAKLRAERNRAAHASSEVGS